MWFFHVSFLIHWVESIILLEKGILARSALPWEHGTTSDHETSDAKIGDVETGDEGASESKMAFLRGLDTVYLLNIEH